MHDHKHPVGRDETPDVSRIKNPEIAHERSDVNIGAVLKFGVGLFLAAVVIHFLMGWMFNYFARREAKSELPPSPLISRDTPRLPPEPRLQLAPGHTTHPLQDLKQLRDSEDALLNQYGWVDQKSGIVRIPIEQAKKLVVQRGLPSRGEIETKQVIPADSSSGRTLERSQP